VPSLERTAWGRARCLVQISSLTNHSCPFDGFELLLLGELGYLRSIADRAAVLPAGELFPGAHKALNASAHCGGLTVLLGRRCTRRDWRCRF
jgi:hypothetical protein